MQFNLNGKENSYLHLGSLGLNAQEHRMVIITVISALVLVCCYVIGLEARHAKVISIIG